MGKGIKILYTKEQEDWIRERYDKYTYRELADRFFFKFGIRVDHRTLNSKANRMGLKIEGGGRYPKGHVPDNKGKKWDEYLLKETQEKCRKTTFKKGIVPPNTVPVGSERIGKDYYVLVKVKDDRNKRRCENWRPKHVLIYEEHYGPIPKGSKVTFLDGNIRNFDIDNLFLISEGENLKMNRFNLRTNDKEITKAGIAMVRLSKKVKDLSERKDNK